MCFRLGKQFQQIHKGASDLETTMDYFALPGKSCENLNFTAHIYTAEKN